MFLSLCKGLIFFQEVKNCFSFELQRFGVISIKSLCKGLIFFRKDKNRFSSELQRFGVISMKMFSW